MIARRLLIELLQWQPWLLVSILLVGFDVGEIKYFDGVRYAVAIIHRSFFFLIIHFNLFVFESYVCEWLFMRKVLFVLEYDFSWKRLKNRVFEELY